MPDITEQFAFLSAITLVTVYAIGNTCQQQFFEVGNSTGYADITKLLRKSIAFSADPCDDFYQFVCGEWIKSVPEPNKSISHVDAFQEMLNKQEAAMLHASELRESRAMASAQRFYEKCLTSEDEWKGKGGSITFVMDVIWVSSIPIYYLLIGNSCVYVFWATFVLFKHVKDRLLCLPQLE
ncbi:hypothetical protein Y032_0311g2147 [Ancylostoma ceylanicum]|uniref:Peptidase M13 N-terminal domain-containing protein n=1 Tax=Ancylostoma ceylanicum TaxID=53326 RepID=A0A016S267_9BILA|nr:hypothetical protein Y032_0311g2147 [Ancylostoma ceylanicum]